MNYLCRTLLMYVLYMSAVTSAFAGDDIKSYIGVQTNYNSFQNSVIEKTINTENTLGGGIYGGVDFNKLFSIEFGYGYYGYRNANEQASYGLDVYVKESLPLSKSTSLNFGVGTYFDNYDFHPAAVIGFSYQLSNALALDFSYKYFVNAFDAGYENQDISSINLGLNYRFGHKGDKQVKKVIEPVVTQEPIPKVTEASCPCDFKPVKNDIVKKSIPIPICHQEWRKELYEIKKNDHLYKIARFFGITIHELQEWNPQYWNERNPDLVYPNDVLELNIGKKVCVE